MLDTKMVTLKRDLTAFSGHVENMIERALNGLVGRDRKTLEEVVQKDEPKANRYEIEMDESCTHVIAQYEPKAKDLRTVLMIMKMTNDLERMGDHAVNIAESGLYLIERPALKPLIDIPEMSRVVIAMLNDSMHSFTDEDALLARGVCERDNIVDGLANQIFRELITYIASDPSTIERALHLLKISGNLERIADLSTNIGEDVIFMVEGKVIKHHAGDGTQEPA